MLRAVAFVVGLLAALAAAPGTARESLRQYTSETATTYAEVVATLKQRMPETVNFLTLGHEVSLSYTGNATPPALSGFLEAGFERLDPQVIAVGQTVSLTMILSDLGDATEMSLMVLARFPEPTVPPMKGAAVMLDGSGPGDCEGQLVLQHLLPLDEAGPAYRQHLEKAGFAFPDADPQETSFFIGHRPGCDLALYLQENRGTSLVVIRYLED